MNPKSHVARVLLVDDQTAILDFVGEFLDRNNFEVHACSDSRQALADFNKFGPDVCLLDFNMPHFTGAQLLDMFKASDPTAEIIFLTGEHETRLAIDLMKRGAIDYLVKPVDLRQLHASVERALDHRKLVQENATYRRHLEELVVQKTQALNDALRNLASMHGATLDALGMALDFRDQSTSGHSRRVAAATMAIARRMGISGEALGQIEQGALLHDIGKLRIPDAILLKPAGLTADEWKIMRTHAEYGKQFLENIDFLRPAAEIVYAHHEKFDGTGYPRALRRTAIPIGARCFTIVDAVDAMVFKRPYHEPISFDQAAAEVRRCAGTHFDPELIDIALQVLSEQIGSSSAYSFRVNRSAS